MFKCQNLILIFTAFILLTSCEDKIEKTGDFNLKSQLEIIQVYDSLGTVYPVDTLLSKDTTFIYPQIKRDTLKDATGKPLLDAQNKLQITLDTTYLPGKKTARYIELDTILLNSAKSSLRIRLKSNARWQAPTPVFPKNLIAWYQTLNSAGGGDAVINAKVLTGLPTKRRKPILATQFIYTRDSLVMYKLTFDQKAKNEQ